MERGPKQRGKMKKIDSAAAFSQEFHGVHGFVVFGDGEVDVVPQGIFQQGRVPHGADGLATYGS